MRFLTTPISARRTLAQTLANRLKDYTKRNTSLRVVPENGELQIEGDYRLSFVARGSRFRREPRHNPTRRRSQGLL